MRAAQQARNARAVVGQQLVEFLFSERWASMSTIKRGISRRQWLRSGLCAMAGTALGVARAPRLTATESTDLVDDLFAFVRRCAREDGGYAPSPDPA
jgi:hypothetical protein